MKFGNQSKAAVFLVYEYEHIKTLDEIITLGELDGFGYIMFKDKYNQGETKTVVYNDLSLSIFSSKDKSVENLSKQWREFNKKHNPKIYEKYIIEMMCLQNKPEYSSKFKGLEK